MAEIELTIRADEDDLRSFSRWIHGFGETSDIYQVQRAIAAALPRPRIQVRPGMVLRRNSDGVRWFICAADGVADGLRMQAPHPTTPRYAPPAGLDPAEWTVVLDTEDGSVPAKVPRPDTGPTMGPSYWNENVQGPRPIILDAEDPS